MKRLLLLLLLFVSSVVFAQKKKDTLKSEDYYIKIIDNTKSKEVKLSSLNELLQVLKSKNSNSYVDYVELYVNLAIELEEYEKAISCVTSSIVTIDIKQGKSAKALELLNKIEAFKQKITNNITLAQIYLKKAAVYAHSKNHNLAVKSHNQAQEILIPSDSVLIADSFFYRGQSYHALGNYSSALSDYNKAGLYYEKLKKQEFELYTLSSTIIIYGDLGFYNKAISEYKILIDKKIKQKNVHPVSIAYDYYNISRSYEKTGNKELEIASLLKGIDYCKKAKDYEIDLSTFYNKLSEIYTDLDVVKAKKYLDLSYEKLKNVDEGYELHLDYIIAKSYYLYKTKQYKEATKIAEQNLKILRERKDKGRLSKMNENLYKIYLARGNYKKALESYTFYNQINDSLKSIKKTNTFSYYQTLYETEKKEKQIVAQEADIAFLDKENEAKQKSIVMIVSGAIILLIMSLFFVKRRQFLKEKKLQQQFSQDLLVTQDEERQRLSQDLHDGLGQSLLMVKNQVALKNHEKSEELLNQSIEEMRTIAKTLYPFQLEKMGVTAALENLLTQLNDNYEDIYIFGELEDIDSCLTKMQGVTVFRIVQECISNIIKHAKAASAKVVVKVENSQILLLIEDNGRGFDYSKKFEASNTLGLKTILERTNFLKGNLHVDSKEDRGSKLTIKFPLALQ